MLIFGAVKVDVGQITKLVPGEMVEPTPGSKIEIAAPKMRKMTMPVIGFTFLAAGDMGELGVCVPRDCAEELHRLLGKALDEKPDLVHASSLADLPQTG